MQVRVGDIDVFYRWDGAVPSENPIRCRKPGVTARLRQVLNILLEGRTQKEIAAHFGKNVRTRPEAAKDLRPSVLTRCGAESAAPSEDRFVVIVAPTTAWVAQQIRKPRSIDRKAAQYEDFLSHIQTFLGHILCSCRPSRSSHGLMLRRLPNGRGKD